MFSGNKGNICLLQLFEALLQVSVYIAMNEFISIPQDAEEDEVPMEVAPALLADQVVKLLPGKLAKLLKVYRGRFD